jgi:hypothetical protein
MTIAKPPSRQKVVSTEDAFVGDAPDASTARWQRGHKTQITLSIAPDLLAEVDRIAQYQRLSRAALLTVWINDKLGRTTG